MQGVLEGVLLIAGIAVFGIVVILLATWINGKLNP